VYRLSPWQSQKEREEEQFFGAQPIKTILKFSTLDYAYTGATAHWENLDQRNINIYIIRTARSTILFLTNIHFFHVNYTM
jgi:hypothetical protein